MLGHCCDTRGLSTMLPPCWLGWGQGAGWDRARPGTHQPQGENMAGFWPPLSSCSWAGIAASLQASCLVSKGLTVLWSFFVCNRCHFPNSMASWPAGTQRFPQSHNFGYLQPGPRLPFLFPCRKLLLLKWLHTKLSTVGSSQEGHTSENNCVTLKEGATVSVPSQHINEQSCKTWILKILTELIQLSFCMLLITILDCLELLTVAKNIWYIQAINDTSRI